MRWVSVILLTVYLFCASGAEPTVEPCTIHIEAPVDAKDENGNNFTFQPGTKVELVISDPAGGIIQFDKDGSTLSEFADDKGTNLLQKKEGNFAAPGFNFFSKISKDGKVCKIEVNSPMVPVKGSTSLKIKGAASIRCATAKVEKVQKDTPLKKDTKVTLGDIELTISATGKPQWGKDPLEVSFKTTSKVDAVAAIQFLKADGTEIKSSRTMSMSGMGSTSWTFSLAESVETATIKAQIWTDMQKKMVPINVTAGVGF